MVRAMQFQLRIVVASDNYLNSITIAEEDT